MSAKSEPNNAHAETAAAQLVLEVLMRKIRKADRLELLDRAGYAPSTWWKWCRAPRSIPGGALNIIIAHLDAAHDRQFTTAELYKPVV